MYTKTARSERLIFLFVYFFIIYNAILFFLAYNRTITEESNLVWKFVVASKPLVVLFHQSHRSCSLCFLTLSYFNKCHFLFSLFIPVFFPLPSCVQYLSPGHYTVAWVNLHNNNNKQNEVWAKFDWKPIYHFAQLESIFLNIEATNTCALTKQQ